jgi:hypothetical protein
MYESPLGGEPIPRKSPCVLTLSAQQRHKLEARARRYRLPDRDVVRGPSMRHPSAQVQEAP